MFLALMTMISLGDPIASNAVLSALQINSRDKIISIKEKANADSNFIITHIIKQIIHEKNRLCLVNFHNPIEHYQSIGKKLGYDLLKAVDDGLVKIIEPIKDIVENIGCEDSYLQENKENVVKDLYFNIKDCVNALKTDGKIVYLLIDDLSHLHDLDIDIKHTLLFVHYCISLTDRDDVCFILNNHVSTHTDNVISKNLEYVADVNVKVSSLKTGKSQDVTGFLNVRRGNDLSCYHYKAFDRGIKTFRPGESIHHLYK
ncbi:unnamed protein product [Diabrotica balteata]|uniref:Elongator complex protein 6 n=3 Tax=Diabrotica TaxID=50385 RepID=A0A9N9T0I0_DIABA|nr:unnamed protein product [Diabrotica balteata]